MIDISSIKSQYSCLEVLEKNGHHCKGGIKRKMMFPCPFHEDGTPSFSLDTELDKWYCFGGCGHGDVIDLMERFEGLQKGQWLKQEAEISKNKGPKIDLNMKSESPQQKSKIIASYPYLNANGEFLYEAVRLEPKSFRQRHKNESGEWVWNMEGVHRVLYKLPQVRKAQQVWICEGEKDCDNLETLGIVATCNVGGAGKWLDSYNEFLHGKDIVICGDNDDPGRKHIEVVTKSISEIAKSIRVVRVPTPDKDISDFLVKFPENDEAMKAIAGLLSKSEPLYNGEPLPLYNMHEMESYYKNYLSRSRDRCLNMGTWLPSLNGFWLSPGDLGVVMAETGIGKSAILTNIHLANPQLATVCFGLELAINKVFVRTTQTAVGMSMYDVESQYLYGRVAPWRETNKFDKVLFCCESRINTDKMCSYIKRSELKIGHKPDLIILDYIQLMQGNSKMGRYERFSEAAEELKRIAKELDVIIIIASQCNRDKERERGYENLNLNDAKETGSIENSCGLFLGVSRNPNKKSEMCVQVLKSSDHGAGLKIHCTFDFQTMRITQNP